MVGAHTPGSLLANAARTCVWRSSGSWKPAPDRPGRRAPPSPDRASAWRRTAGSSTRWRNTSKTGRGRKPGTRLPSAGRSGRAGRAPTAPQSRPRQPLRRGVIRLLEFPGVIRLARLPPGGPRALAVAVEYGQKEVAKAFLARGRLRQSRCTCRSCPPRSSAPRPPRPRASTGRTTPGVSPWRGDRAGEIPRAAPGRPCPARSTNVQRVMGMALEPVTSDDLRAPCRPQNATACEVPPVPRNPTGAFHVSLSTGIDTVRFTLFANAHWRPCRERFPRRVRRDRRAPVACHPVPSSALQVGSSSVLGKAPEMIPPSLVTFPSSPTIR